MRVHREDTNAFVEYLASRMVSRTEDSDAPWELVEIWRAGGRVAAGEGETHRIELRLAAARTKECFAMMRSPEGHACARCLAHPMAAMMRHAAMTTFAPGIALVGRCWLLAQAELVDIETAALTTYARGTMAARAGLATAVAVPVLRVNDSVSAVVVVYFAKRLDPRRRRSALAAMCRGGRPLPALEKNASPLGVGDDRSLQRCRRRCGDEVASVSLSPDPRDRRLALKLHTRSTNAAPLYPCPVCFATLERAVTVRACAHSVCADCFARWTILSDGCPACGGFVDAVCPNPALDKAVQRVRDTASRSG